MKLLLVAAASALLAACSPSSPPASSPSTGSSYLDGVGDKLSQAQKEREIQAAYEKGRREEREERLAQVQKDRDEQYRRAPWVPGPASGAASPAAEAPAPSPDAKKIDAEVAAIMAAEHGELPRSQRVGGNAAAASASLKTINQTAHTLTVLYSGPTSQRVEVPPHGTTSISIAPGLYKVAAKVDDPSVIPFAGEDRIAGGLYENSFFITTTFR